jgi:hypothetical protein
MSISKSTIKQLREPNPPRDKAAPFPWQAVKRGGPLWRMAERQIRAELMPRAMVVAGYARIERTPEGEPVVAVDLAPPAPVPSLSPPELDLNISNRAVTLGILAQDSGVRVLTDGFATGGLTSGITRRERQRLRQLEIADILRTAQPRYRNHQRSGDTLIYVGEELHNRIANHTVRFPGWGVVSEWTIKRDLEHIRLQGRKVLAQSAPRTG